MIRIAHLVDDTGAGGVTRYLDFLAADPVMARRMTHRIVPVSRTRPAATAIKADLIVSHLTVTWRGLPGLMALRARHAGTPIVHVEHSYCAGFVAANVRARRRFHTLLRTAYALFDRVVAVSEAQAEWLRLRGLVSDAALSVIPPCVELKAFHALPAPEGCRTIGAIGRFDRQKGFDLLIRAFRALPEPTLVLRMIGDGEERARLEALAEGDPRIRFEGFASDPVAAMAGCDAVAMPSRWEPYGLVALEARAAGRRLLVSGADGLADHVGYGATPVQGGTVEAWTEALQAVRRGEAEVTFGAVADGGRQCRSGWDALVSTTLGAVSEPDVLPGALPA
ncbi:Glycosyltransferase involved in cell wall bisynthesis [Tranquillimonas rosea]|uniref:Glycosyltransferase involved in cell wall bisynthesis n=1 Tax=Tranquillimonas rosea TaxID=641238 RepID=A0A1H9TRR1_9RHOB|nr:glycosyltransferase family 4 protein [Tranquillimonas rosea]SER99373.1 Glycosyltransferase involved in cell wall bisynthesis [Tranquillimonas rosea]